MYYNYVIDVNVNALAVGFLLLFILFLLFFLHINS